MATMVSNDDRQHFMEKETCVIEQTPIESESESDEYDNSSHALRSQLTTRTNAYILSHWPFESTDARHSFLSEDLTGLACLCFPFALDNRIHLIARLFSVVYLLGELISELDQDDALDCLQSLQEAVKGYWATDRSHAEVWMLVDLLDEIGSHEYMLVGDIMEAIWAFLGLRIVRRGRRTAREHERSGFQDAFMAAGLLLPLHRFATGLIVDEDEFNRSPQQQLWPGAWQQ